MSRQNFFSVLLWMGGFLFLISGVIVFSPNISSSEVVKTINGPAGAKDAELVGTEMCATCHEEEAKAYKLSTHARVDVKDDKTNAQGCEICHGPGSIHVENGGGKGTIVSPKKNPEICFTCHTDKKAEFRLPFRHPVLEGKISCSDCHSPHGQDVKPWSSTGEQGVNEVCFKCHTEKRGPYTWEHEALSDGCTACHKVHGSVNDKMLVARDNNLCLRCHAQIDFPNIGTENHWTSRLPQGTCFSSGCHEAVHGSMFSKHLRF